MKCLYYLQSTYFQHILEQTEQCKKLDQIQLKFDIFNRLKINWLHEFKFIDIKMAAFLSSFIKITQ